MAAFGAGLQTTLLRWHRRLVTRKGTYSTRRTSVKPKAAYSGTPGRVAMSVKARKPSSRAAH